MYNASNALKVRENRSVQNAVRERQPDNADANHLTHARTREEIE